MEKEIIFFEKQDTDIGHKPPNHETNPACGTPNPPPWCGDPNSTNIDMGLFVLIFVGLILLISLKWKGKFLK